MFRMMQVSVFSLSRASNVVSDSMTAICRFGISGVLILVYFEMHGCKESYISSVEPIDTTVSFVSRGLQGFSVYSVREGNRYIYACTHNDGLFRISRADMETAHWEYLGLKDNSLGTYGVMDVAIFGDNDELIIAAIANDDTLHAGLVISGNGGRTWTRSDSN